MNIQQTLQYKINAACKNFHIYGTAYINIPHKIKSTVLNQIYEQYGQYVLKRADYITFYVINTEMNDQVIKNICDANNSLGVKPEYKIDDIHILNFENQPNFKTYAFTTITKEQLYSYDFLKDEDTKKPEGIDIDFENNPHPIVAVAFAEENNLGPNETIVDIFTPDEKLKLSKMIKHGEFNQQESAILQYLMSEAGTLESLAVMLGARSERTKGKPMSKVAALKEINRILNVVAKRSQAKLGKRIDLAKIAEYRKEMKAQEIQRKKEARENKKKARIAYQEFQTALKELWAVQTAHNLPRTRYDKIWTQNTQSLDQMRDELGPDRI